MLSVNDVDRLRRHCYTYMMRQASAFMDGVLHNDRMHMGRSEGTARGCKVEEAAVEMYTMGDHVMRA